MPAFAVPRPLEFDDEAMEGIARETARKIVLKPDAVVDRTTQFITEQTFKSLEDEDWLRIVLDDGTIVMQKRKKQ